MATKDELQNKYPDDMVDVTELERGEVVRSTYKDGVHIVVLRGGASWCAYLGVPESHPLADREYDDLPLRVHGGLTYAGKLDGKYEGEYFYGWDYAHMGDHLWYEVPVPMLDRNEHKWTIKEVYDDAVNAVWDFKSLMKLVEKEK